MITTEKKLDDIDKKILKLAGDGLTAKEIAYEINEKQKAVERRIRIMKEYYQCKSTTHLVTKLINEIR